MREVVVSVEWEIQGVLCGTTETCPQSPRHVVLSTLCADFSRPVEELKYTCL
jgi:hypothetical protein